MLGAPEKVAYNFKTLHTNLHLMCEKIMEFTLKAKRS